MFKLYHLINASNGCSSKAQYIKVTHYFQAKYANSIPLVIFGAMSIIGAILTFFLPETCDQILPNTIEDANSFGEDQGYLECILCVSKLKRPIPGTRRKRLSTYSRTLHYSGHFPQELLEDTRRPVRKRWNSIYEWNMIFYKFSENFRIFRTRSKPGVLRVRIDVRTIRNLFFFNILQKFS